LINQNHREFNLVFESIFRDCLQLYYNIVALITMFGWLFRLVLPTSLRKMGEGIV